MKNPSIGNLGLGCAGNVKPSLAVSSNSPSVTRVTVFVTSKVEFTPRNVRVAVLSPEPNVTELVPSPLQTIVERQSNTAWVAMVVETVKGSARASVAQTRENTTAPNVFVRCIYATSSVSRRQVDASTVNAAGAMRSKAEAKNGRRWPGTREGMLGFV
jgi:hypothetical protein